ncbi:MAG TPA: DEAD/DEAH box helicase [Verrucomicrobiae bacterium]|nr:DEAD/DEAH box helicase [Verrucomicrobiae bacterium]
MSHALALSPGGHLLVEPDDQAEPKLNPSAATRLTEAFTASGARGLEILASEFLHEPLPPTYGFWRGLARRYFTALCHNPNLDSAASLSVTRPGENDWIALAESAPPMKGLEYLSGVVLARLWDELDAHAHAAIVRNPGGALAYLKSCNPTWNTVGRVTFHLAENKRNPAQPFAFLATYTNRVSEQGKAQHLPLGRALEEYAGAKNRAALAALLSPVQRAAEQSKVARQLLDSRAIFHPQVWRPEQAFAFLKEIPLFEQSGLVVRIPDWWKAGRPPRPQVSVRIGEAKGNLVGKDNLLDFQVNISLEGEPLTESELKAILQSTSGLTLLKGKWVEVDKDKLQQVLEHWKKVQSAAGPDGLPLLEGLRLLSGFQPGEVVEAEAETTRADWSSVTAGEHLKKLLDEMQRPEVSAESDPGQELRAELRPYQRQGAHWLWFMNKLGLGACLADDMGLGKTIQVISLLLALRRGRVAPKTADVGGPSLLIVPASLIANWKAEIQKFAPSLQVFYAHPSESPGGQLAGAAKSLAGNDLVITSYSMAVRLAWLKETPWNIVVLDEAQAIKNAGARQSRAVKELRCRHRIALSGTPIENRLSDLWSLFDFLCPGLLGGAKDFAAFVKSRSREDQNQFAPLRRLVRPYILRRLKTDKRIISDLPDKTEVTAFCPLTRRQAALYQQSVNELAERLDAPEVEGIQRRGIILAFLTRFKQICNHPSQWLGDGAYAPADSGKFHRLRELCDEIASKQEKVLVFTQYREVTDPLTRCLESVFGQSGVVLHGGTPVSKRKELVDAFQRDGGPPFFVLSLKAGGTGLNLTAASHVIHFDRWWNPAVENQATDRAFRIGQKRNVMVHKFTCRGTLEERIHDIIAGKSALADDILGEGAERLMTEMNNSELLRFVALDIKAAAED